MLSNRKISILILMILFPLFSSADQGLSSCDSSRVLDSRLSILVGLQLPRFSLTETEQTKAIIDYQEQRLWDLPLQAIPEDDYVIKSVEDCIYSGRDYKRYNFYVLENSEGQIYRVPVYKIESFVRHAMAHDTKKLSFLLRSHEDRYGSTKDAIIDITIQSTNFCRQFNRKTQLASPPQSNLIRNESMKWRNFAIFSPKFYGLDWDREISIQFNCQ